jgi:hypothetical protein
MLRTTPPPEGIGQLRNDFVTGSKATSVLSSTPDSLYQTVPSPVEALGVLASADPAAAASPAERRGPVRHEHELPIGLLGSGVSECDELAIRGDVIFAIHVFAAADHEF